MMKRESHKIKTRKMIMTMMRKRKMMTMSLTEMTQALWLRYLRKVDLKDSARNWVEVLIRLSIRVLIMKLAEKSLGTL